MSKRTRRVYARMPNSVDGASSLSSFEQAPWSAAEFNTLLAAARTMPGMVGEIPARHWWPALILTAVECGAFRDKLNGNAIGMQKLLDLKPDAFDRGRGALRVGGVEFDVQPVTLDALLRLLGNTPQKRLFPWPFDNGRKPFHMLLRNYRALLWRAGLPHASQNLFSRLQLTGWRNVAVLGHVNLATPFSPRSGRPPDHRRRDRKPTRQAKPKVQWLVTENDSPRTLRRVFEERYLPIRLQGASKVHVENCRSVVNCLKRYIGRDATLDDLTDEFVCQFMASLLQRGRSPYTANRHRGVLLALWRFAWRKHLVNSEPRDVEKARVPKRLPQAWTLDELARLLTACANEPGTMCGIPAGQWWVGFVLTLYLTALRVGAGLSLKTADFDPTLRILFVAAEEQKHKSDQVFHLPQMLVDLLVQTRPANRVFLFPACAAKKRQAGLRAILKRAGLPAGRRDLFHKLRRTSATLLADVAGAAIASQHLDHSSQQLTRDRYIDPRQIAAADLCKLLPLPSFQMPE